MPNPDTPLGRGCGTSIALFLAGGVIAVGASLVGVGLRFKLGGDLPRLPWSAALPLGGLLLYAAQSLLWTRWSR